MNKPNLINFIGKYYLNGSVEKVVINSTSDNKLMCKFVTDTKSVIGELSTSNLSFEKECNLGIYDTASFLKLLSAMSDEFKVNVFSVDDESKYIEFHDEVKKATFILSHPDIIPKFPKEVKLPQFDFEITIDDSFIDNFIKSKNALTDANTFAFKEISGILKVILNHSENNQSVNTISFDVGKTIVNLDSPLNYDANIFKEILSVNRNEFETGIIKVSSKGIMEIVFNSKVYSAKYYQVMLNK